MEKVTFNTDPTFRSIIEVLYNDINKLKKEIEELEKATDEKSKVILGIKKQQHKILEEAVYKMDRVEF